MLSIKKIITKMTTRSKKSKASTGPLVIPRSEHNISRKHISSAALKVLYSLKDAGFDAYLVGGCVRDLLLGYEPKDFDVTTNATPEQVHKVFRRSRLIGRRFKLVHVRYGREVIEVATFRAPPETEQHSDDQGRIMRDNVYGTLEQDAWRRDFSINALYYSIDGFTITDFTGGMADLDAGVIRLLGDVETRYREDPVRMLRAIRFVGKLGLKLDEKTEDLIFDFAHLLADIPAARLFDECLKLYLSGNAAVTHELLCHYGLFDVLFPQTAELLHEEEGAPRTLLMRALENTDLRIEDGKPVTPAFLFAALLWEPVKQQWQENIAHNIPPIPALQRAATDVISQQVRRVAIPKRFTLVSRDIWTLQPRLEKRFGKRAVRLISHPKFRAGYDFLLLRAETGEADQELAEWWTRFQEVNEDEQQQMVKALSPTASSGKGKRRRRRKKPAATTE